MLSIIIIVTIINWWLAEGKMNRVDKKVADDIWNARMVKTK